MLLKGLAEAQSAPSPIEAAEMMLVRLAYVADLPSPGELVRTLDGSRPSAAHAAPTTPPPRAAASVGGPVTAAAPAPRPMPAPEAAPAPGPQSFLDVVELFDQHREAVLRSHLVANVHLVNFEPGRIELRPTEEAPRDLSNKLGQLLTQWTGQRWVVMVSAEPGRPTLREETLARERSMRSEAAQHPLVRAVLETFPGARIEAVRELALPEASDPESPDVAEERSEGDEP
jgi:DNA polymerase-3 subunit gamma/tau